MAEESERQRQEEQREDVVIQAGPLQVDWPRALGYYGGIGLAVAAGMVEPPLALFIAAVPLFKMLNRFNMPRSTRVVTEILDGAAIPVGGSAESMFWLAGEPRWHHSRLLEDARAVAGRYRARRQSRRQVISTHAAN